MSKYEVIRGKTLLLNLNNAHIRYSRAKEEGTSEIRALAHEVAYLQARWREHLKKVARPVGECADATEPLIEMPSALPPAA